MNYKNIGSTPPNKEVSLDLVEEATQLNLLFKNEKIEPKEYFFSLGLLSPGLAVKFKEEERLSDIQCKKILNCMFDTPENIKEQYQKKNITLSQCKRFINLDFLSYEQAQMLNKTNIICEEWRDCVLLSEEKVSELHNAGMVEDKNFERMKQWLQQSGVLKPHVS